MSATIISIPQLAIAIEPNVTNSPTQDEFRVSATIRPLTQFSHKFVTAKKFHVIIDLDTSGSMSSIMNSLSDTDVSQNTLQTSTIPDWLNIGQFNNITTRLDCSIKAIKKLLEFFRVLSENGIEVFFTLNGFNHRVNRVFEYARIPSVTTTDNRPASIYTLASRMVDYQGDPFESPMSVETVTNTPITNPTSIKQMFSECGGIGTHGSTNIHNVIVHTNELKQKYGNSQDMQTISILLSDGYVTSGF
jgi:hypothetical protein